MSSKTDRCGEEFLRVCKLASVGELLAGAAHSIGNALMAAQGSIELAALIARQEGVSSGLCEQLEAAVRAVGSSGEVVRRLLDFSSGKNTGPRRVSLAYAARAALALCETHPAARERKIVNLVPAGLPHVEARLVHLQEAILNLVVNALQATEPGGEVRLEAAIRPGEAYAELSVIDNGCGIQPEVRERLFEPFFSTKGGTGIGLSTSAMLLRETGGMITVDSQPGVGSTFTIHLPIAQATPAPSRSRPPA